VSGAEILGWVGLLIGVVGIGLTVWQHRRSRIGGRLAFMSSGDRLIGFGDASLPERLQLLYDGREVPRLTKTEVIFWNAGVAFLRGHDVVPGDPLRVEVAEGAEILDLALTKVTNRLNAVSVVIDAPRTVAVTFDYLEPGDGARLEVLHTGKRVRAAVRGTIRGMPAGIQDRGGIPEAFDEGIAPRPIVREALWVGGVLTVMSGAAVALYLLKVPEGFGAGLRPWYVDVGLLAAILLSLMVFVVTLFALMGFARGFAATRNLPWGLSLRMPTA
jgi:hypothetical protein